MRARTGTLYNEPRLLLMEELREPRNYFSILRAMAQGRTRMNEITLASGVPEITSVARYLDILQQMRLVTRHVPVTENQPDKSKKGLYRIDDHFLRFWFRYVHPNQASLDLGLDDIIFKKRIQPDLDDFVSSCFEEAARAHFAKLARTGQLSFIPERIGGWWDRVTEIDVVAYSETDKTALIGECKWSVNPIGINVLEHLKAQAQTMLQGTPIQTIQYALFSRSGFTAAMERQAAAESISLITVKEMVTPA